MMEKRGGKGSELVMIYVVRIIFTLMAVVVDLLLAILNKEHRFQEPLLFKCSTPSCYDSYIFPSDCFQFDKRGRNESEDRFKLWLNCNRNQRKRYFR